MFEITEAEINLLCLKSNLINPEAGACVTFEGWVRCFNEGKTVTALHYECYTPLAQSEGERILNEARARFPLLSASAIHRMGALQVGDLAVWVGVSSPHRKAAFEACQYIMEEIKHRLPIWKKEFYRDGHSEWVNCACSATHQKEDQDADLVLH